MASSRSVSLTTRTRIWQYHPPDPPSHPRRVSRRRRSARLCPFVHPIHTVPRSRDSGPARSIKPLPFERVPVFLPLGQRDWFAPSALSEQLRRYATFTCAARTTRESARDEQHNHQSLHHANTDEFDRWADGRWGRYGQSRGKLRSGAESTRQRGVHEAE